VWLKASSTCFTSPKFKSQYYFPLKKKRKKRKEDSNVECKSWEDFEEDRGL
jgi:hypothetical protein